MDRIKILNDIMEDLRRSSIFMAYTNRDFLNKLALDSDINDDELCILLKICNILYNNTNGDFLPIDDGVYDILLEKYKSNHKDWSVGSENIVFPELKNIISFDIDQHSDPIDILSFDKEFDNKINNSFYLNDILYPHNYMNYYDIIQDDHPSDDGYLVTKKGIINSNHNYPELVGTLDKCKFVLNKDAEISGVLNDSNIKVLERDFFGKHISQGIIDPYRKYHMTCELKYDGVSIEALCENGIIISATTRGDTDIGQGIDVTDIFYGYTFPRMKQYSDIGSVGVKFEAIIQKDDLERFNQLKGCKYANCRTAIIGLIGSNDANKYKDLITLVPLQIDNDNFYSNDIQGNRVAEIEMLNIVFSKNFCPLRYIEICGNYIELLYQINMFLEDMSYARDFLPFMYDGIVVSYIDEDIRNILGRENHVNKYSIAVKFSPLSKFTTFRGYTYTIGQDGRVTPMIHYDPVEFFGTIHTKSTGHSFKRFKELDLSIGDILEVKYVNDVMPYVSKPYNDINENHNVKEEFPLICPTCGSILEFSDKSARCTNINCEARVVSRLVNTFSKLNCIEFGEATIIKIGKSSFREIMEISDNNDFKSYGFGDKESINLKYECDKIKSPNYDYILFGSLGFTNIASKSWKLIFSKIHMDEFLKYIYNLDENRDILYNILNNIKGLGNVSIDTILNEIPYFIKDIDYIRNNCNIIYSFGSSTKKQIRCTGFRNKELFSSLRDKGYDADDNGTVTKSTDILLVPYDGYNSGNKLKKISDKCIVVDINTFINTMDKYLN